MMLLVGLPAIIFYPTHCLLLRYAGKESAGVEVTDGDANSFRIGIWRRHLTRNPAGPPRDWGETLTAKFDYDDGR
jgi:hypothetical protein